VEPYSAKTEETYVERMSAELSQREELANEPTLDDILKPVPQKPTPDKQPELISIKPNMKLPTEIQENSKMKPLMTGNINTLLLVTYTETWLKLLLVEPSNISELEAGNIRNVSAEVSRV
jgi:hypothetical protein